MIADLKPYASYQEASLSSLGLVPTHWKVVPIARVAALKSTTNQPERQLLSVYLHRGVVRFVDVDEKRTNPTSQDLSRYQVVDPGDFVLNNQQAWRGSVGISPFAGIVSPAYLVLSLSKAFVPGYANLLFRDRHMVSQYLICSKGVGTIQRNLYWPHLKRVEAIVPPVAEQVAILRFLSWASGRLDRAIRSKRKVIALLNEQKQAVIHRAVTRGVDPNAAVKPSGVPLLGDIPKHWDQKSLWTLTRLRAQKNPGNLPLLSVFLDRGVIPYGEGGGQVHAPSLDLSNYQVVRVGDFVLNNQQAWRGSVGVSRHSGIISPAYIVLELSPRLNSRFANFLMRSRVMVDQFVAASKGVGDIQRQIFWPFLRVVQVPIPEIDEQGAIVAYLETATAGLTRSISQLNREIELLVEYRTRLVADVVTGKLDVREAAAKLPDDISRDTTSGEDVSDEIDNPDEETGE